MKKIIFFNHLPNVYGVIVEVNEQLVSGVCTTNEFGFSPLCFFSPAEEGESIWSDDEIIHHCPQNDPYHQAEEAFPAKATPEEQLVSP